jgi:DNA-directed RNA polymerase I subunit RPA1
MASLSSSVQVLGGESMDFVLNEKYTKMSNKKKKSDEDNDAIGEEDGISSTRFGHKHEVKDYGEMDDEDMEIFKREEYNDDNVLLLQEEKKLIPNSDVQIEESRKSNHEEGHENNPDLELLGLVNSVVIEQETNSLILRPLRVDPSECPLLMVELVERAASCTVIRSKPNINKAFVNSEKGRGKCLQTEGCNIEELWNLTEVDHNQILSNDIWAIRCAYGVEAARQSITEQIRGVFAVYGISVDPRHLGLIADYMTYNGGYKPMSRIGIIDSGSPFLQMSFETTSKFLLDASINNKEDNLMSPSANIVIGKPIQHGTGAFDCIMNC